MSCVTCHLSRVVCHLSHVTNTTSHSHKPSPCYYSLIMHSRLVAKTKKLKLNSKCKNSSKQQKHKKSSGMPILLTHSSTKSLQSTGKRLFRDGTNTQTDDSWTLQLRDWIRSEGRFSENIYLQILRMHLMYFGTLIYFTDS